MPRPIATIDTSVLVSLQVAGLLGKVTVLFERVLVPVKVREELEGSKERSRDALSAIYEFAIFESCDDYDPALVKWLLDSREAANRGRDQGEAEAVIQAAQRPESKACMVLVDDQLGREWAKTHSRECHGSIWLCRQLRVNGYLTELRPYFVRMIEGGQRHPLNEMNNYLQEFGEAEITDREYREYSSRPRP
jgi:predicted nucleic acid-binding protein